ncbi:MAG TPA: peptidoglycan DD-metalloendopeptidase family protein [Gammaproteobacteria bacterium]|nr:peptidoglycan DD-metalloendopeptidase family protein [Gammaproteobacteria bacterium]
MNTHYLINRDIKSLGAAIKTRSVFSRPSFLILAGAAIIVLLASLYLNPHTARATRNTVLTLPPPATTDLESDVAQQVKPLVETPTESTLQETAYNLPLPAAGPAPASEPQEPLALWQEVTVKSGDSIAAIFARFDIPPRQLHTLLQQGGPTEHLKKIYPGQTLRIMSSAEQGLMRLSYPIDRLSTLEIARNDDAFDVSTVTLTPEFRSKNASGVIDSSLFLAAGKAGLSDTLTMELAGIFGWDIDFALDIRKGDRFTVLYEEMYADGENIGNGSILAAEFINHGKRYQAIRYTDAGGKTDYYSLDGKSMRKAFLRTPVEFSRISSGFSLGRKHPVLNTIRAHKGVDYAASAGTPIKATSDGKIVHRGKKGGYGNTIIVQHGNKYSTLYAHMSKYRSGLATGSRVKQGQIIGYVGSSGLATGPHLHYEFRVDGVHRDPLRVKLPGADPLANKYRSDFDKKAEALMAQLDLVRDVQLASTQ